MAKLLGKNWTVRFYVAGIEVKEYNVQNVSVQPLGKAELEGRMGTDKKYLDFTDDGFELTIDFNKEVPKEIDDAFNLQREAERNNMAYPLIGVASIETARGSNHSANSYLYSPCLFEPKHSSGGPKDAIKTSVRFLAVDRQPV